MGNNHDIDTFVIHYFLHHFREVLCLVMSEMNRSAREAQQPIKFLGVEAIAVTVDLREMKFNLSEMVWT